MNQSLISHTEVKTEVGYIPLLNAPAGSYDTLKDNFNMLYMFLINWTPITLIVVDQALF